MPTIPHIALSPPPYLPTLMQQGYAQGLLGDNSQTVSWFFDQDQPSASTGSLAAACPLEGWGRRSRAFAGCTRGDLRPISCGRMNALLDRVRACLSAWS